MRSHYLSPGRGVFEVEFKPARSPASAVAKAEPLAPVELIVWWGDGIEPTRAAWLWRQRLAGWAVVGQA